MQQRSSSIDVIEINKLTKMKNERIDKEID